jgi:hypothetical protein
MNTNKRQGILMLLLISSLFNVTLFLVPVENDGISIALGSVSVSNSSNIVSEGNSTFTNSSAEDGGVSSSEGDGDQQDIATVIVIPNPNSVSNSSGPASNPSSVDIDKRGLTSLNDTDNGLENNNTSQTPLMNDVDVAKNSVNNSENNPSTQPQLQRGEYLVDNNGVHYYNINNCSMVKGSSGIGDLSECEDAEREIQEELGR